MTAALDDRTPVDDPAEPARKTGFQAAEHTARALLDGYLPAEALERLALLVTPARIRARRLEERDATIRQLAGLYLAAGSGREIARRVSRDLTLYRRSRYQPHAVPCDERHALMHRILTLGGRSLGWRQIFDIVGGVQKSPESAAHGQASNQQ